MCNGAIKPFLWHVFRRHDVSVIPSDNPFGIRNHFIRRLSTVCAYVSVKKINKKKFKKFQRKFEKLFSDENYRENFPVKLFSHCLRTLVTRSLTICCALGWRLKGVSVIVAEKGKILLE